MSASRFMDFINNEASNNAIYYALEIIDEMRLFSADLYRMFHSSPLSVAIYLSDYNAVEGFIQTAREWVGDDDGEEGTPLFREVALREAALLREPANNWTEMVVSENLESCSICLASFEIGETAGKTACKHVFHSTCINEWVRTGRRTCPYCRSAI